MNIKKNQQQRNMGHQNIYFQLNWGHFSCLNFRDLVGCTPDCWSESEHHGEYEIVWSSVYESSKGFKEKSREWNIRLSTQQKK